MRVGFSVDLQTGGITPGLDNAPQNLLLFALEDGAGRSLLTGSKQFYLD